MIPDEALARVLRDTNFATAMDLVAEVRAAGWVPLTEVEEALRAEARKATDDSLGLLDHEQAVYNYNGLVAAANLVASLRRKP